MFTQFKSFCEIPLLTKEYILSVSQAEVIEDLDLSDINSFLVDQEAYYASICDGQIE